MGQYWELINVSLKERGLYNGGAKWIEFFFNKHYFLLRSLAIPFPSAKVDGWLEGNQAFAPGMHDRGILRFPNELLLEIVELCPDVLDKVCFAVTCKRILSLSRDHIEEYKKKLATPWVGRRLICIGEYVGPRHLPRNLLTKKERGEVKEHIKAGDRSYGGLSYMLEKTTPLFTGNAGLSKDKDRLAFLKRCSRADRKRVLELHKLHYPRRDDWVVCNLTNKQYVRAKAIAEIAGAPADVGPFLPRCYPDLGHVILYQICWSTVGLENGCNFIWYKGNIAQGQWAGHRFVITTLDRLPSTAEGESWKDVSAKVSADLAIIWEDRR